MDKIKVGINGDGMIDKRNADAVGLQDDMELVGATARTRADMWEVAFWEDSLYVDGREVSFLYQVHNEAILVPENIDAIRALIGLNSNANDSINKTNASLGIEN